MTGRRARRDVVRRHHPDVGGSAEALIEALAALDASGPGARQPAVRVRRTCRGRFAAYLARRRRARRRRTNSLKKAQR
ncbi:hypothetical protein [Mycolicibacterium wolinskyi]|uniref:hypothetical protein n=1 Tax=Mycolicibacterium wolinskyi TaxID=59750 RepID=UPI000A01EFFE|nr:hypothetical protein [Mycolicibacterium wolinskyi]